MSRRISCQRKNAKDSPGFFWFFRSKDLDRANLGEPLNCSEVVFLQPPWNLRVLTLLPAPGLLVANEEKSKLRRGATIT
jgi:hypothetical protein